MFSQETTQRGSRLKPSCTSCADQLNHLDASACALPLSYSPCPSNSSTEVSMITQKEDPLHISWKVAQVKAYRPAALLGCRVIHGLLPPFIYKPMNTWCCLGRLTHCTLGPSRSFPNNITISRVHIAPRRLSNLLITGLHTEEDEVGCGTGHASFQVGATPNFLSLRIEVVEGLHSFLKKLPLNLW